MPEQSRLGLLLVAPLLLLLGANGQKLYEHLGVKNDASAAEIKRAYRKLSRELHPDVASNSNDDEGKERYMLVQKAYEVLKDEEKRKQYDQEGDRENMSEHEQQNWEFWQAQNLFEDSDVEQGHMNLLYEEQPRIVLFWSAQMALKPSLKAGKVFKEFVSKITSVLPAFHFPCFPHHGSPHEQLGGGIDIPSVGLMKGGAVYWHRGDVTDYSLQEWLGQMLRQWVPVIGVDGHIRGKKLTPKDFPLTNGFQFVAFKHRECEDCYGELLLALAKYFHISDPQFARTYGFHDGTNRLRIASVDCALYPDLCSQYGAVDAPVCDATGENCSPTAWTVASIKPPGQRVEFHGKHLSVATMNKHSVAYFEGSHTHSSYLDFILRQEQANVQNMNWEEFVETIYSSEDAWLVALALNNGPDCEECNSFRTLLEFVGRALKLLVVPDTPNLRPRVAIVDCSSHIQECMALSSEELTISAPGLVIYSATLDAKTSDPYQYTGKWNIPNIVQTTMTESTPIQLHMMTHEDSPDMFLYNNDYIVLFAAGEWCPPCTAMKPVFRQAARLLQHDGRMKIVQVDCDSLRNVCQHYDIGSYPTLLTFARHNGKVIRNTYSDQRSPEGIAAFAREALESPVQQLGRDLIEISRSNRVVFVLFSAGSWCPPCRSAKRLWPSVASQLVGKAEAAIMDCDSNRQLCGNFGIKAYPTFILYTNDRNGQRKIRSYSGSHSVEALVGFARKHARSV